LILRANSLSLLHDLVIYRSHSMVSMSLVSSFYYFSLFEASEEEEQGGPHSSQAFSYSTQRTSE